jgi:ketosteroid isomerase-like protein
MDTAFEKDVMAVARNLVQAFGAHDTDRYFSFFAPEATFIFYTHDEILESKAAWETLWAEWEETVGYRVLHCESSEAKVQKVNDDVAVFTHTVTTRLLMDGDEETAIERETIVFRRDSSGWVAVHEHLSPMP